MISPFAGLEIANEVITELRDRQQTAIEALSDFALKAIFVEGRSPQEVMDALDSILPKPDSQSEEEGAFAEALRNEFWGVSVFGGSRRQPDPKDRFVEWIADAARGYVLERFAEAES